MGKQNSGSWILLDPTPENPEHTRQLKVATMCRCEREIEEQQKREEQAAEDMERIRTLKKASLMDEKFSYATFEHFKPTKYNERNLKLCLRYAEKFDLMLEKNQGLLFWGDVGTGRATRRPALQTTCSTARSRSL